MSLLRISFKERVPVKDFSAILACISELYHIFSLAYAEELSEEEQIKIIKPYNFSELSKKSESVNDLHVVDCFTGSVGLEITDGKNPKKPMEILSEWLKDMLDPYQTRKKELSLRQSEIMIKHQEELYKIEYAKEGIELIEKAMGMYNKLIEKGFPDSDARSFFYSSIRCSGIIRHYQELNKDIINIELIEEQFI
jgi:hypothetical protein